MPLEDPQQDAFKHAIWPVRIWRRVEAIMPNPSLERRQEFITIMNAHRARVYEERTQLGPEVRDDFEVLANHLTNVLKVIKRLGTERDETGVSALARLNGRLQWAPGSLPLTLDQWQDVFRSSITVARDEAQRIDDRLQECGRKGRPGRRPVEARDQGLNDLCVWWSENLSTGIGWNQFCELINDGMRAERARNPRFPLEYLLGERDTRDKALRALSKRAGST